MRQERKKRDLNAIQLPQIYQEEDRGYAKCCTTQLVLANDSGNIKENDITPAWIQLSDGSDTVSFIVRKCSTGEEIEIDAVEFVNQQNAYYCEVYWEQILASLGVGQYQILIVSNIGGIDFNFTWGTYDLRIFSIETAMRTVRLRAVFNLFHEIENIDFTGSNVNGTIRFKGAFGFRDPNTQMDNLMMQGRKMESVVRENLNRYTLKTDPLYEPMVDLIMDLYLLSENNLWISDHNAHNHSYKYRDLFVSLEEKITP